MEIALASMFSSMLNNAIQDGFAYLAKNPEVVEEFFKSFGDIRAITLLTWPKTPLTPTITVI